jgi:hypothetical protein
MQELMVTLIVVWCCAYAAWALLPDAARRGCARRLLSLGLPAPLQRWLQRTTSSPTGCACDGCDVKKPGSPASSSSRQAMSSAPAEQPIRIHRSLKR